MNSSSVHTMLSRALRSLAGLFNRPDGPERVKPASANGTPAAGDRETRSASPAKPVDGMPGWTDGLNARLKEFGLASVESDESQPSPLGLRSFVSRRVEFGATVSVVLPVCDDGEAWEATASSLLAQTWRPLELIVVDDTGGNDVWESAVALASGDSRVKVFRNPARLGRAASLERAWTCVTGRFLLSLAAGDWAHPAWIERFLSGLLDHPAKPRAAFTNPLEISPEGEVLSFPSPEESGDPLAVVCPDGAILIAETAWLRERADPAQPGADTSGSELTGRKPAMSRGTGARIHVPGLLRFGANRPDGAAADTSRSGGVYATGAANAAGSAPPLSPEEVVTRARLAMNSAQSAAPTPIEPVVWMYWSNDGSGRTRPPYLDTCLHSVQRHSGCKVRVCDADSARELLPELPACFHQLIPAHQADLFRIGILAKYGGMYVDFDTFVLRSLAPLFDGLKEHELFVTDWCPRHRDPREWYPMATSVIGPSRPGLPLMRAAFKAQLEALGGRAHLLGTGGPYPFGWTELLDDIYVRCYFENVPDVWIRDGAATWYAVAGGTQWWGGNLLHPLRSMREIGGELPDSELFTIANNLLPDEIKHAPVGELLKEDTVLAHLLRRALR